MEPDWLTIATEPGRKDAGMVPSQAEGESGLAEPMQLGPRTAAEKSSAIRCNSRAAAGPSAPDSTPSPGTTNDRTPSARASRILAAMAAGPTASTASSGGAGNADSDGTHGSPATSELLGWIPTASAEPRRTLATSWRLRRDAPTSATDRGAMMIIAPRSVALVGASR